MKQQVIYSPEDVETAKKYITDRHITSIEIGFADINGSIIGKRLPSRFLLEHPTDGTSVCRAPLTLDIQSEYFTTSEFAAFERGASDMTLKPSNRSQLLGWIYENRERPHSTICG